MKCQEVPNKLAGEVAGAGGLLTEQPYLLTSSVRSLERARAPPRPLNLQGSGLRAPSRTCISKIFKIFSKLVSYGSKLKRSSARTNTI
eukprot:scaffold162_cov143-Skeletonema_menzelii.AAC.7